MPLQFRQFARVAIQSSAAPSTPARKLAAAIALQLTLGAAFAAQGEPTATTAKSKVRVLVLPAVEVRPAGTSLETAGAAASLDAIALKSAHVLNASEALRKLPGVNVRDEEGFGLRPNIGLRGLNPTRSTKVLLLEDGAPASYAPYGDNASYYHAPIERYARIELLTGAEMLRFGPQSIGGVINYLTPTINEQAPIQGRIAGGSRGFSDVRARFAGSGLMFDTGQKRGDGARENTALQQRDLNFQWQTALGENQGLSFKASLLREASQVSYSGITDAERSNFGARYNPFGDDSFDITRSGLSVGHRADTSPTVRLETHAYAARFARNWWRQASTTTDTQCGTAFRDARIAGRTVNAAACASVQGRLRNYRTYGVEPRLIWQNSLFGADGSFEFGMRGHLEEQERRQINGITATARTGALSESNLRDASAFSSHLLQRLQLGAWRMMPIVRFESVKFERSNLLNGRAGSERVSRVLPGLGVNFALDSKSELFLSAHRGFSPPRVEDLIDSNGGSVDVDAEDSRQLELGFRKTFSATNALAVTAFQNNFNNQLAVGSIAGGAVPLAQGKTQYRGVELSGSYFQDLGPGRAYLESALTWLPTARQQTPLRAVATGLAVSGSAAGNRLPYAPKQFATLRLGYLLGDFDASVEASHIGRQFADFANLALPTGTGQFGAIGASTQFHLALNWQAKRAPYGLFVAVKNLTNRQNVVDRTRGLLFSMPRHVQIGLEFQR